jgi:hypothetical protein
LNILFKKEKRVFDKDTLFFFIDEPRRTRTFDPLVKSQLLYRLSYGLICTVGASDTRQPKFSFYTPQTNRATVA